MNVRLAALDFITSCLSVRDDPSHNDTLCSVIESRLLDWKTVIGLANLLPGFRNVSIRLSGRSCTALALGFRPVGIGQTNWSNEHSGFPLKIFATATSVITNFSRLPRDAHAYTKFH